ncbi:hypothetical protein BDQ17DRAFT_1354770 [Cyathus striatus]|nr:hypothetical protein BDQ17DRAFT_1354770 [Cyathus striatus]
MKALQEYLLSDNGDHGQVEAIATDLGKLHAALYHDTGVPPEDVINAVSSGEVGSDTAKYLSELAKEAMSSRQMPDALQLSERILHSMLQENEGDDRFGMWDFWPGSVLVGAMANVALIDWEYFSISSASSELGMFSKWTSYDCF